MERTFREIITSILEDTPTSGQIQQYGTFTYSLDVTTTPPTVVIQGTSGPDFPTELCDLCKTPDPSKIVDAIKWAANGNFKAEGHRFLARTPSDPELLPADP